MSKIIDEIQTYLNIIFFSMCIVYIFTVVVVTSIKLHGLETINKLVIEIYESNPNTLILIPIVVCFATVCTSILARIIGKLFYGSNYFAKKPYYQFSNLLDFSGLVIAMTSLYILS